MTPKGRIQLLSSPGGTPGDLGFKMTGHAREGAGLCRVWLRRSEPWERYLDPREAPSAWDVRVSVKSDSAFVLRDDLNARNLEELEEAWSFPDDPATAAYLTPNGDPVHDRVIAWAKKMLRPARAAAATPAPEGGETPAAEA